LRTLFVAVTLVAVGIVAWQAHAYMSIPTREAEAEQLLLARMVPMPEFSGVYDESGKPIPVGISGTSFIRRDYSKSRSLTPFASDTEVEGPIPNARCWTYAQRRPITGIQVYKADYTDLEARIFERFSHLAYITIDGRNSKLTEAQVTRLLGLPTLKTLRLHSVPLSQEQLAIIGQSPRLEEVCLISMNLDDLDLSPLFALPNLKSLDLHSNNLTSLPPLARPANLLSLKLGNNRLTDKFLQSYLPPLTSLKQLQLDNCPVGDDWTLGVEGTISLEDVSVADTRFSDVGLARLARLPAIKNLVLNNSRVTGESVEHLAQMASLRSVWLFQVSFGSQNETKLRHRYEARRQAVMIWYSSRLDPTEQEEL
jgi:hypothetical protein